jgi:hypothetical protein
MRQFPAFGVVVERGRTVRLVVARALPRVPNVEGLSLNAAKLRLRNSPFSIGWTTKRVSSSRVNTVLTQHPSPGTQAMPGREVNLVVAKPKPKPKPPNDGCSPYYVECVPIASDVDCAGGTGDGPVYVYGPIHLKGSYDPYGLDGYPYNGVGCE